MNNLVEEHVVYFEAYDIHRNDDDFHEGDLGERIEQFTHYELSEINISDLDLDEWYVDQDLVNEIAKMPVESMPPIIWDQVNNSIIDGIHRANAMHKLGYQTIKAYVGKAEYLVSNNNKLKL